MCNIFNSFFKESFLGNSHQATEFAVYPNPAAGTFYIKSPDDQFSMDHLVMLDLTGKEVPATWERSANGIRVNTPAPPVSYVVHATFMQEIMWRVLIIVN